MKILNSELKNDVSKILEIPENFVDLIEQTNRELYLEKTSEKDFEEMMSQTHRSFLINQNEVKVNGNLFVGKVNSSGKPEGWGKMVDRDGNFYVGYFESGSLNGPGISVIEGKYLQGNFEQGKLEGEGKMITIDGMTYLGQFEKGLRHGNGEESWKNGCRYKGKYSKGAKHGVRSLEWPERSESYTGKLENNVFQGYGIEVCNVRHI